MTTLCRATGLPMIRVAFGVLILSLASGGLALAGEKEDKEKAEGAFKEGVAQLQKGDYDEAIKAFDQSIKLAAQARLCLQRPRKCPLGQERHRQKPLKDYNRAIELKPTEAEFYRNRAIAYMDKGDLDKAMADYSQRWASTPRIP